MPTLSVPSPGFGVGANAFLDAYERARQRSTQAELAQATGLVRALQIEQARRSLAEEAAAKEYAREAVRAAPETIQLTAPTAMIDPGGIEGMTGPATEIPGQSLSAVQASQFRPEVQAWLATDPKGRSLAQARGVLSHEDVERRRAHAVASQEGRRLTEEAMQMAREGGRAPEVFFRLSASHLREAEVLAPRDPQAAQQARSRAEAAQQAGLAALADRTDAEAGGREIQDIVRRADALRDSPTGEAALNVVLGDPPKTKTGLAFFLLEAKESMARLRQRAQLRGRSAMLATMIGEQQRALDEGLTAEQAQLRGIDAAQRAHPEVFAEALLTLKGPGAEALQRRVWGEELKGERLRLARDVARERLGREPTKREVFEAYTELTRRPESPQVQQRHEERMGEQDARGRRNFGYRRFQVARDERRAIEREITQLRGSFTSTARQRVQDLQEPLRKAKEAERTAREAWERLAPGAPAAPPPAAPPPPATPLSARPPAQQSLSGAMAEGRRLLATGDHADPLSALRAMRRAGWDERHLATAGAYLTAERRGTPWGGLSEAEQQRIYEEVKRGLAVE